MVRTVDFSRDTAEDPAGAWSKGRTGGPADAEEESRQMRRNCNIYARPKIFANVKV